MLQWKQVYGVMAAGAVIAVLATGPALAQQAAPQGAVPSQVVTPAAVVAAPSKPVLRARDLMTPEERGAYRQQMRAAREDVARRQQLREQWKATLRQRAAARGGVLWEPGVGKPGPMDAKAKRESKAETLRPMLPPRAP